MVAGTALLLQQNHAFTFDIEKYFKIQSMKRQFSADSLGKDQQTVLMQVAGFGDMDLFMSKHLTADEFKESMKQEMKDKMLTTILSGGGIDISNPLWRKKFFNDKDNAELFTETMQEPIQSIIRLTRSSDQDLKDYGKKLLKQFQYKKFNRKGDYISENFDEILLATDKQAKIKELMKRNMLLQIEDPLDRAMMYNLQQQQVSSDSAEKTKLKADMKDFQTIKLFQKSVPDISPVNGDDIYAVYSLTHNTELKPNDMINLALGENVQGISDLDFERYFGSPAKQFTCRAHKDAMRVPCGYEPSADECLQLGCCYLPNTNTKIPACFSDLYGKIGSTLLRSSMVNNDPGLQSQIKGLFRGNTIPSLSGLLKSDYESKINSVASGNRMIQYGKTNWWDAAKIDGEDGAEAHLTNQENAPRYGRPGFQWRPHGPTASPYQAQFADVNPTAMPGGGGLNNYYQMWLSYTDTQDQAQCALISKHSRIKCMDNFDALKDHSKTNGAVCKDAGCCFNEDSFLDGSFACYRASDYGSCVNLPETFEKSECGYEGIAEGECLSNPRCCYKPSVDQAVPWCFYKYSSSIDEDQWCSAWNLVENRRRPRTMCWNTAKASGLFNDAKSNINNIVSRDQCLAAGCCFDDNLTTNTLDWIVEGLGQGQDMYRCFRKENPALDWGLYKEIDWSKDGDGKPLAPQSDYEVGIKTCMASDWGAHTFKQSCGEQLSYYQCVYVNKCCYQATTTNQPVCYKPEDKA